MAASDGAAGNRELIARFEKKIAATHATLMQLQGYAITLAVGG